MALLDSMFNPQTYAGNGGWLSQYMQGLGQFPAGQIPQGFPQEPSQLPPQAQPTQAPAPQMQQQMQPGMFGSLGNLFTSNMLVNLGAGIAGGNGLAGAISGGLHGAIRGREADRQQAVQNSMYQQLAPKYGPAMALMMISNPKVMEEYAKKQFALKTQFNQGGQYGSFDPTTGDTKIQGAVPQIKDVPQGGSLVEVTPSLPGAGGQVRPLIQGGPKFDDVSSMRKEISGLPEVKRYGESLPIFRSMIQSHNKDSAAADLDYVYGVAKIFDPDSVVREGEMKLVGQAQSIPEDVKGFIKRVAYGEGRLTPEARQRILEVAQTRMNELRGSYDTRVGPYSGIAQRNGMRVEDILPQFQSFPTEIPRPPANPTPLPPSLPTATNPQTGEKLILRNGQWVPLK